MFRVRLDQFAIRPTGQAPRGIRARISITNIKGVSDFQTEQGPADVRMVEKNENFRESIATGDAQGRTMAAGS